MKEKMIQLNIWKDPRSKCIRWGYNVYKFDKNDKKTFVKGWEGPSLWYGKEFFDSWRLWKFQYRNR